MLFVCKQQIRGNLEQSCPAWNGALTKINIKELESIQRSAVNIILCYMSISYRKSLNFLKIQSLEERRKRLCTKFAIKCAKSSKFKPWFRKTVRVTRTHPSYIRPKSRTAYYEKSPLIYLTKLLTEENKI